MRPTLFARPLLIVILALAGTVTAAVAQDGEFLAAVPEIVSSASAEQPVRADLATVTLRFSRVGRTPADAGRSTALAADSLRRALRPLGIAADSIISASTWYWWRGRVEEVTTSRRIIRWREENGRRYQDDSTAVDSGFRVSESLQVRIRDLRRVGAVIDAALAAGITDISEIAFSATNTETEQREAIRLATQRARAHAETIALAAGARLGRTLRLSTDGNGAAPRYMPYDVIALEAVTEGSGSGSGPGNTVVVGPVLRVTATVHGRWQLIEGN